MKLLYSLFFGILAVAGFIAISSDRPEPATWHQISSGYHYTKTSGARPAITWEWVTSHGNVCYVRAYRAGKHWKIIDVHGYGIVTSYCKDAFWKNQPTYRKVEPTIEKPGRHALASSLLYKNQPGLSPGLSKPSVTAGSTLCAG